MTEEVACVLKAEATWTLLLDVQRLADAPD